MPVIRWTLTDPTDDSVYTFHLNPESGGSPQYKKQIESQTTTAPDGNVLLYEGAKPPKTGSVTGTILSLAHYQAMVTWWEKSNPVVMTDDLGRTQTIYIVDFLPERKRSTSHRYLHPFTINYVVLATDDL